MSNNKLDFCKLLSGYTGKLYSPIVGTVEFVRIDQTLAHPIVVKHGCRYLYFFSNGRYLNENFGECMLFPSKDNRKWKDFVPSFPEGTPFMCSNTPFVHDFRVNYYCMFESGKHYCFCNENVGGFSSKSYETYDYMIPFDKFDPTDFETTLKYNVQLK